MSVTGGGDGEGDARTIVRPPSRRPPQQFGHTLPAGTRLRDYEISDLIGEGGFGIVYLAWDHSLQRKVAVKEYMPASMASRLNGSSAIVVKSDRHVDTFRAGLKSFVNEARLLARFDHPSLVKVYRFWEENGTAYMVMPFYEGPTLKTALAELGHVPSETELRRWLAPLLDALAVMHASQCYHRDIAPDNILLTPTGPLLLDFGAARRVISDMTHALTVVLKPGYAPIEQYGDVATMAQGAWTDLYALACVVYYAITGKTPMSSVERLMDDRLEPLAVAAAGRYSHAFLSAIDLALAVRPQDRPQNERQFRNLLDAGLPVELVPPPAAAEVAPATPLPPTPRLDVPALDPVPRDDPLSDTAPFAATSAPPATTVSSPARRSWRRGGFIGLAVLTIVVIGAVFGRLQPRSETPVASGPATPASAVEPSAASASAPSETAWPTQATHAPMSATPSASAPRLTSEPAALVEAPTTTPAPSATTISAPPPAPLPAPTLPRRETPPPRVEPKLRSEPVAVPRPAPPRGNGVRCSDILQKASLEPLTAEEAMYLRRECR